MARRLCHPLPSCFPGDTDHSNWTVVLGFALTLTSSGLARSQQEMDVETALEVLLDNDSDSDGVADIIEVQEQTDPLDAADYSGAPGNDVAAQT